MDTAEQLAIQKIIAMVDTYRAASLHLSVGNPPMIRVGEKLVPVPEQSIVTPEFMEHIIEAWLDEKNTERLQVNKELIIAKTFETKKRFRISVFYQQGHLSATLIPIPDVLPSIAELDLPSEAQQLVNYKSGLVLFIGPYNSQKAITVASFIEYLNQTAQKSILTIEHPVEYLFSDNQCVIDQREVGKDVHSTTQGLEFALNEDADVIMVSELTDSESFQKVLELTNTGKVVYALLHVNTVPSAIDTFIHSFDASDQGQARAELASNLVGIINQRSLVSSTGDKVSISEVMIPNQAVRTIIQKGEVYQINNILQTSRGEGMRSLDAAQRTAVEAGKISQAEAAKVAVDRSQFQ